MQLHSSVTYYGTRKNLISMLSVLRADVEPGWAGRLLYGSVFGSYSLLGAAGIVISFMKTGNLRFFIGACSAALLALALHSLILGMGPNPPAKKLSSRMSLLVLLSVLPWTLRFFLR